MYTYILCLSFRQRYINIQIWITLDSAGLILRQPRRWHGLIRTNRVCERCAKCCFLIGGERLLFLALILLMKMTDTCVRLVLSNHYRFGRLVVRLVVFEGPVVMQPCALRIVQVSIGMHCVLLTDIIGSSCDSQISLNFWYQLTILLIYQIINVLPAWLAIFLLLRLFLIQLGRFHYFCAVHPRPGRQFLFLLLHQIFPCYDFSISL